MIKVISSHALFTQEEWDSAIQMVLERHAEALINKVSPDLNPKGVTVGIKFPHSGMKEGCIYCKIFVEEDDDGNKES